MSIALSEPAAKEELAGAYQPSWHLARRPTKHASGADTYACVLVTADNWAPTAPEAERFHELFDRQCKRMGKAVSRRIAMDFGEVFYTYADLRDRANRLARFLKSFGVGPGSRVGLLLDRSIDLYAVILALSRLDAAYVPLDSSFPADRAAFILNDSVVDLVLSLRAYKDRFEGADAKLMLIDDFRTEITRFSPLPCSSDADGTDPDPLAYIIYTSGTTGQPKGVPVRQSQICNFLTVATHCYGYLSDDRVYQSLTVAFDFSFEEIWVPLLSGATLVPAPSQDRLAGEDLHDFLVANRITAMCVVPTLLATIEPNLPLLRMLMVSGEACPRDLIAPWFAKGRRILNAYGPTETTVTATWSVLSQDRPVTIGGPLPTYAIVIVDPDTGKAVDAAGVAGEICIAGQGVFDGYLNRPEQTARALTPDYIGMPDNPGGQLYRTGDLGQFTADNEVEYLGRIDTQVKIRGYRIELGEIEAVARAVDGVLQAVVEPYDADGDGLALVAYMTPEQADEQLDFTMIDTALRAALPAYMIPAYYEQLASLPMLASDKVNRRALPVPSSARFVASDAMYVAPYTEMQVQLAQLLADTLKVDRVSVEADFFKDLSADSLKLASYVTLIRKQLGIRRISMRKLYEHTSIAALALWLDAAKEKPSVSAAKAVLEETELPAAEGLQAAADAGAAVQTSASPVTDVLSSNIFQFTSPPSERTIEPEPKIGPQTERSGDQHRNTPHIPTRAARWATGLAQTMFYATAIFATFIGAVAGYEWSTAATRLPELYFRSVVSTTLLFFGTSAGLIAVKWLVIGRFTMEPIPVYSLNYLRFWIAQRSIRSNPMTLFIGTPMYATFLRLLGMSIGRDTVILSLPPVCTDLVSIGSHTAIRQDSVIQGYTSSNGYIYPGTVSIGSNVLICEATVLDINTVIGDGSHLGTTSSLLEGQQVPAGECWQGSPAEPSASRFDRVEPIASLTMRKLLYTVTSLSGLCLLSLPASIFGAVLLLQSGVSFTSLSIGTGLTGEVLGLGLGAAFIYFSGLLIAMFGVLVVPRILNLFIVPEVSHPVYGAQYELARAITRTSNSRLLNTIFGDSSMIVHWLSMVGYDLSKTTQTGSNFGVDQRHHSPFLCSFDRNTLVSDGLLMMNMETTSSAFRLRHVAMPPDTYVGNLVHYPADSRLGPNCLIATKAALPIDGPMRTDVGILGSPPFEIPRSVVRDQKFDHFKMPGILEQRLRMKLRSNLVTLGLYLLRSWLLTALGLGLTLLTFAYIGSSTVIETSLALTVSSVAFVVLAALFSIGFERNVSGFRRLQPRYCSLYDPLFWAHERFWKLNYNAFLLVFNGTPMKPFFLRLQGARVGSNVFDDGAGMTEPSMTSIGDDCTLNYRATMQCHSLEDGTFKSDRIRIGDRCTIGVSGFVHYGAAMQDDATLDADAFLMKGSLVEAGTRWLGNPARDDTDNAIFSRKSSKSIGAVS